MQANRAQIKEQVIDRLVANGLRCPFRKDSEALQYGVLVEEYLEAIYERQISPQGLHSAMSDFVRSWPYARWPTIGQLLDYFKPPPVQTAASIALKPSEEIWADRVMKTPEGQEALANGYGRELYLWAEKNAGKSPDQNVIADCQAAETRFRASFRRQIDEAKNIGPSDVGPSAQLFHSVLLTAGSSMDGFENKLKKDFYSKAAQRI